MEKKSALIGGGIGLAVGMATMFGLVLGIGSCAGSQNVKKFDSSPDLVLRPKFKTPMEDQESPKLVYYFSALNGGLASSVSNPYLPTLSDTTATGLLLVTISERTFPGSGTWTFYTDDLNVSPESSGYSFLIGSSKINVASDGSISSDTSGGYLDTIYVLADSVSGNPYFDTLKGSFTSYQYGELGLDRVFTPVAEPVPYEGNVVTEIFQQVVSSISSFGTALGSSVTAITSVFYQDGAFTMLGYLTLITGGVALVYWCFYLLKNALHIGVK